MLFREMREAKLGSSVSYSTGVSACEKVGQWQRALSMICKMCEAGLQPDTISCSAGISACGGHGQWQRALPLLGELREARLEPDVIALSAGIGACERGGQWHRTLQLLSEVCGDRLMSSACVRGGHRRRTPCPRHTK
ncbi:unnamed protein product [Prorocentrum cordatum]|uniref:Pentatricopeptide repeat-containing protein n=1 Tax=Prorocentrum cordatum TaxID=2364126 RepID=A0ABN9SSB2_9DINO|nr:unnamed protein product [Polarella glacialis]